MIKSLRAKLASAQSQSFDFRRYRISSSSPTDSANKFIVFLLRGKKLSSFLFNVDYLISSTPKLSLENKIDIDLPLTILSDSRIDNEQELSEYFEYIIGFYDIGVHPSILLLDPGYFFNVYFDRDSLDDIDLDSFSPHIPSDTVYKIDKLFNHKAWNLSFASRSLLTAWTKCLTSTGSDCAYVGSLFYPLVQELSLKHESFGLLDVHNSSCSLLLSCNGRLVSKYLPFGVNQYQSGSGFMADDFVNRLSKSIVKVSSDNALSSPKQIYFLSDQALDTGSSRFFNLCNLSTLLKNLSSDKLLTQKSSDADYSADNLHNSLLAIPECFK